METATTVALSRLIAQQRAMDVTATNLANMGTPGFKAERTLFADWLSPQTDVDAPRGDKVVAYTQDRATYRSQTVGPLNHTANSLDLAIAGDGYFTVQTQQGPRLTRAGRFSLQRNGTIGDSEGNALLDVAGQPVRLSPADTSIHVTGSGIIASENGRIGKIGVVRATDPNRMQAQGDSMFTADTPTTLIANPHIVQGALEDSNVQPVEETTRMIGQLRDFQFVTQFVQAESDREKAAIDKLTPQRS